MDESAANAALVLIGVAISLLNRQIATQANSFEEEGGFTERLYRIRQRRKSGKKNQSGFFRLQKEREHFF